MKRIFTLIGFMIAFALLLSCNNEVKDGKEKKKIDSQPLQTVTVGVHAWPGGGPIYIGAAKDYFKEVGIDLQIKKIENFDTKRAALIAGSIDIDIANTLDQLVIYTKAGFPAQVIAVTDESVGGDGLVGKSSIKDLSQLVGKKVAYAEASPSDFFLRYLLDKKGIDINQIKLVPVADPQIAGNTVIAGQVDAAVTYEPYLSQAAKTEGYRLISTTKEFPKLIPGLLIANGNKISQNQELYQKFLTAWFKSVNYYNTDRSVALQVISGGMGMDIADVKDILSGVDIQSAEENVGHFNRNSEDNLYELARSTATFWQQNGFINETPDAEKLINGNVLSALQQ